MVYHEYVRHLPLVTAVIWYAVVALQVYRDRARTWTEASFLLGIFFGGTYAFSDWIFFGIGLDSRVSDQEIALIADYNTALLVVQVGLSALTLCVAFLFLFTKVFLFRMRARYLAFLAVPVGFLVSIAADVGPFRLVDGLVNSRLGYFLVDFNDPMFGLWLLYIVSYTMAGLRFIYRTAVIARRQSKTLARRTLFLVAAFGIILFLGLSTNALFAVMGIEFIPLFSTFLAVPGFVTLVALTPITRERLSEAMRRFKARRYTIRSAYLIYRDGTLIASRSHLGAEEVDRDLFSATLDVIENFMRTSFPLLRGKWLRTIEHGNLRIVIERGRHAYLALVIDGEENDLLRRQMRDELVQFERTNADVLPAWRGIQEDARDTDALFEHLFEPAPVF
jgi:hypothetical protein